MHRLICIDISILKQTVKSVLDTYTGEGSNGYNYLTSDPDQNVFTNVCVGRLDGKDFAFVDLLVRIAGDHVIIVEDRNSEPLYESLLDAGVPRKKIILVYASEPSPEGV
ncbi:MAG: XisI protein [Anaerolineae bacterium]|nr:XisI protein [Anaerolineae bacterium]